MKTTEKKDQEIDVNEALMKVVQNVNDVCNKCLDLVEKSDELHKKIHKEMADIKRDNVSTFKFVSEEFDFQRPLLGELKKITEATEGTLLNVFLAIRQNEYLQAWYPEQKGYPEMKVVGPHPSKLPKEVTV